MTKPRQLLLVVALVLLSAFGFSRTTSAHNSLVSSDPADGATLDVAPTTMTFRFDQPVPLDTISVELIDATGVRTDADQFVHGPNGDSEVVATLAALGAGEVTVRWRLVGPDGHPVTGRIGFTVTAAAPTTTTSAVTTTAGVPPSPSSAVVAAPATTPLPTTTTTTPPAVMSGGGDAGFAEPWTTPDPARWLFRAVSYLAIVAIAGIIAASAFVWEGAAHHRLLRQIVGYALATTAFLALAQLLVIASDIEATAPWSAWGGLSAAFETDAGGAFGVRILLVGIVVALLYLPMPIAEQTRWLAAGAGVALLLGTWAFAGHSRSMRWPLLGIPLDIAHHAAAAAWLGGLAIVGLVATRECSTKELTRVAQRFAQLAPVCVGVIVATGLLQGIRLVGNPGRLFEADHGRYLVVKLLVLGAMLWVADVNRRRVNGRFLNPAGATRTAVANLRRAMATELTIGLAIIGITAAMVVSPPAVANDRAAPRGPVAEASGTVVIGTTASTTATSTTAPSRTAPTTAAATTTVAAGCTISGALQRGAAGDDVRCLQETLIAREVMSGSANGDFDDATDQAVRAYQETSGLDVDGVVGPLTATSLGIWSQN